MEFTINVPDKTIYYIKKILLVMGMLLSFGFVFWIEWFDTFNKIIFYGMVPLMCIVFFVCLYGLFPNMRRHWILLPTIWFFIWFILGIYTIYLKLDDIPTIILALLNSIIQLFIMWVLSVCVAASCL